MVGTKKKPCLYGTDMQRRLQRKRRSDWINAIIRAVAEAVKLAGGASWDKEFMKEKNPKLLAYLQPASWGTIGGVMTDEQMHVLREDGTMIENVFAVGETATSRLFGDYYLGGFSLGLYFTAGRIAAETAVAELNGQ